MPIISKSRLVWGIPLPSAVTLKLNHAFWVNFPAGVCQSYESIVYFPSLLLFLLLGCKRFLFYLPIHVVESNTTNSSSPYCHHQFFWCVYVENVCITPDCIRNRSVFVLTVPIVWGQAETTNRPLATPQATSQLSHVLLNKGSLMCYFNQLHLPVLII